MAREEPVATHADDPVFHARGDGVFEPTVHARGPWDLGAQHGGAPAALLVRAIEDLGTGLGLSRLTVDFLGPVPLHPLTVAAAVVRPGRRFAIAEAIVEADGRRRCFARAVLVRRTPVALPEHWAAPAPEALPPPSAGGPSPFPGAAPGVEGFHLSAMEIRFVAGSYGNGPADVWFRFRRPLVDAQPASPLQTLAAAADFGNGVSHVIAFDSFLFVNLDLTIQVTREPRGEWMALAARTELGADGTGVARSVLHDGDGVVGDAAQTLFVAPR
jgi:Thioesterase-like superfamily